MIAVQVGDKELGFGSSHCLIRLGTKEDKIDPMWSADEGERRLAFARRAAAGARRALGGK